MHGSIGPSAALARWSDGALEITSYTQGPFILRGALARALGLEPEAIRGRHVAGPAATATTAPTTPRWTRRWSPARCRAGPCW